jgi:uncharacterized small protein (DUF1192 family)
MTEPTHSDEYDDVNEAVVAEWTAETTPYERVRGVISRVYDPLPADTVAERARTSPKTARKHLSALAEEGFVETEPGAHGGTTYRRSRESLVVEQAADILDSLSVDELISRISELRESIQAFEAEYGVGSPEEFTVDQANRTLSETERDGPEIDSEALREWQTTRRNLAFANAALSIANAERFVGGGPSTADGAVPAESK